MKPAMSVAMVILILIAAGYAWLRNQAPLQHLANRESSITTGTPKGSVNQPNTDTSAKAHFGRTALSKEEKQILHGVFANWRDARNIPRAYTVAVICMKHHLKRNEIRELIEDRKDDTQSIASSKMSVLRYDLALSATIRFEFDQNGNLQNVSTIGTWYELPSIEEVTASTPIEPPPVPEQYTRQQERFREIIGNYEKEHPATPR